MRHFYTRYTWPVKAKFRAHYTLRLPGLTIHIRATHAELLEYLKSHRRAA